MRRLLLLCTVHCLLVCSAAFAQTDSFSYVSFIFLIGDQPAVLTDRGIFVSSGEEWTSVTQEYRSNAASYGNMLYSLEPTYADDPADMKLSLLASEISGTQAGPFETLATFALPEGLKPYSVQRIVTDGKDIWFMAQDDTDNWQNYTLCSLSLTDFTVKTIITGPIYDLAVADGNLLVLYWDMDAAYAEYTGENELQRPELLFLDAHSGEEKKRVTLPGEQCGSLAVDTVENKILVADTNKLYRMDMDGDTFEVCAYLHASTDRRYASAAAVNGTYTIYYNSQNGTELQTVSTDPSLMPDRILRIAGNSSNENVTPFEKLHPDTAVEFTYGSIYSADDIAQQLMSEDSAADIYEINLSSDVFDALCQKGYYVDLGKSETIRNVLDSMYPNYVSSLSTDGVVYGFPADMYTSGTQYAYNSYVWNEVGLTEDDVPATYVEYMDLIENWFTSLQDEYPDYSFRVYTNRMDRTLMESLMSTQMALCLKHGDGISFDTPAFTEAMKKLESILPLLRPLNLEDESGGFSWSYGELPTSLFSDFGYTPLPTTYLGSSMSDPTVNQEVPVPLTMGDNEFVCPVYMTVYMINPYSKNQDLAIEFLEYNARNLTHLQNILFVRGWDKPMENPYYDENMKSILEFRDGVMGMLEAEDTNEETRASMQETLDYIEGQIALFEQQRYAVSPEQLESYQARQEEFVVMRGTNIIWNEDASSITDRFLQGNISAEQFVKEYQRIIRMIQMETE